MEYEKQLIKILCRKKDVILILYSSKATDGCQST